VSAFELFGVLCQSWKWIESWICISEFIEDGGYTLSRLSTCDRYWSPFMFGVFDRCEIDEEWHKRRDAMGGIWICRKANNEKERSHVMRRIFNELRGRESENWQSEMNCQRWQVNDTFHVTYHNFTTDWVKQDNVSKWKVISIVLIIKHSPSQDNINFLLREIRMFSDSAIFPLWDLNT
jgi:hypothetical protein